MTLQDWQVEWNGLVMGDGTDYVIQDVIGLHTTPGVRTSDLDRSRRNGQWPGDDLVGGRALTSAVEVIGEHPSPNWDAISRAHVVGDGSPEAPLRFKVPGVMDGREGIVFVRCRHFGLPTDQDYAAGQGHAQIQWWATDPNLYDATETVIDFSMADNSGAGLTFPIVPPFTFGGAIEGGIRTATNEGEFPAPWSAVISGPIVNPRVENIITGETLSFVGELAAGETLHLDSKWETILLNGTADRYRWYQFGSRWFDLAAGDNQLRLAGTSGTGTMQLRFRSAWN